MILESIGARIRYVREHVLEMTQADLSKFLGVAQQSLSIIENDRVIPSIKTLRNYSEVMNISFEWLVHGGSISLMKAKKVNDFVTIPVFTKFNSIKMEFSKMENTVNFLSVSDKYSSCMSTVLRDDSMNDLFLQGSFIVFDSEKEPIANDYVIAIKDEELFMRRYTKDMDQFTLQPLNKAYKSIPANECKIIGVAVLQVLQREI
ncbi:LexA family transcriptional regulator [bacterium]|nr:LexA family transcriptional regulator [bacterium]